MAGMVERELECFLCRRHFVAWSGDFIVPEEIVCADCLAELGRLAESELESRITACLAQRNLVNAALVARVAQGIRRARSARKKQG